MKLRHGIFLLLLSAVLFLGAPGAGTSARFSSGGGSQTIRYQIDPSESSFMVHAPRGGLAWFRGHSHDLAVRDFSGHAELTLGSVNPASLQMTIRADSLEETGAAFTDEQKKIIKKELEAIALETAAYPEITFTSTGVQGKAKNGGFDVRITGDLTMHGVTRRVVIPAMVTVDGDTLRARGQFKLNRKDFNIKATTAFHGLVRVRHTLKFTFDIVGRRV